MYVEKLTDNLNDVRRRIAAAAERAGRHPDAVTLIAVTKGTDANLVDAAIAAGVAHIGENRVQEAQRKFPHVDRVHEVQKHMIGHLQTNKVRHTLPLFDLIHSLDRPGLGEAISRRAERDGVPARVLIQVNAAAQPGRHGVSPDELLAFVREMAALPSMHIEGLMTMAPFSDDPETARPVFRTLRQLADEVAQAGIAGVEMKCLSMGMTNDFEVAIEEGSTMVRIGTALFGPRMT